MGLREQYQKHELEIKKLLDVPEDEPIFIFRAQDEFSIAGLHDYNRNVSYRTGMRNKRPSVEWMTDLGSIINDFINWQQANPNKVKVPD